MPDFSHLTLEEEQSLRSNAMAKLDAQIRTLDGRHLRLFAADCAEHVLHMYDEWYPSDQRPRMAVDLARLRALGQAAQDDINRIGQEAIAAGQEAGGHALAMSKSFESSSLAEDFVHSSRLTGAALAATAASSALLQPEPIDAAFTAAEYAATARSHTTYPHLDGMVVQHWRCTEEYIWQLTRAGGSL